MSESQRNILIVVALAALAMIFSGAAGTAIFTISQLLNLAFAVLIVLAVVNWYRGRGYVISSMPSHLRLLLQFSLIMILVVFITGTVYPNWAYWGGFYTPAFFTMLAACGLGIYWAWSNRH